MWIGDGAFASDIRLRYVVAHEIAHAWQYLYGGPSVRSNDLVDWGYGGHDGLERAADCLAMAWGARTHHYWDCPTDAQRHIASVFDTTR